MQTNNFNKSMGAKDITNKEVISPPLLQEFHFSGEGIYKPQLVKADNHQEALEIYEKTREEINKIKNN